MMKGIKVKIQKQQAISDKYYEEAINELKDLGLTKENFKKFCIIILKIILFIVGIAVLCVFSWVYLIVMISLIFMGLSILKWIF